MQKVTPDIWELQPVREHRCQHCPNLVFGNQSHYQLHLRQRHKLLPEASKSAAVSTVYHCPVGQCIYHADCKAPRSFSSLRLLRQHYQKSHLDKNHMCEACGERFLLQRHLEKHRCVEHKCPVCELTYSSSAGLRTHMRRKNHLAPLESNKVAIPSLAAWKRLNPPPCPVCELTYSSSAGLRTHMRRKNHLARLESNKVAIPSLAAWKKLNPPPVMEPQPVLEQELEVEEQIVCYLPTLEVQYALIEAPKLDTETQTEFEDLNDFTNEVLAPLLRDIETQTPETRWDQGTMTELLTEDHLGSDQQPAPPPPPAFAAYPENESMFGLQTSAHMYTQTCDELFEELGLSHIHTQTYWPDNLHNNQHTQTCEEMLDELGFLDNFQSACTQTRWLD
ncbi:hypothetical protein KR018_008149, partial [Drosophila ironensis]